MRINALEDQETGFQCGDADDNDEGRYMLFYFLFAKFTWYIMRERYSRWCKSPLKFKRRERPTSVGDGAISLIGRAGLNTRGHECTYMLFYFFVREIYRVYNEETQKNYWRFYL